MRAWEGLDWGKSRRPYFVSENGMNEGTEEEKSMTFKRV